MKPKTVQYSIQDPCHEPWNEMKPDASGRFCESCSKTVVDFSTMSDFSIVSFLETHKNESVCGRFSQDQLEKSYVWMKPPTPVFGFDLKAVALGLALSTFSALPSQAQTTTPVEQHDTTNTEPVLMMQGEVAVFYDHTDETFTSGKIKLNGNQYEGVRISLLDGNSKEILGTKPDKNGAFRIPLDWSKNPVLISISAQGYYTETIYFSNYESLSNLRIELKERRMIKGKVVSDDQRY